MHTQNMLVFALAMVSAMASATAQANDRTVMLPLAAAMGANDAQAKLGNTVKFYFGDQQVAGAFKALDSAKTSQKTNAFAKSDTTACNWVFLSAILQLQKHAQQVGADVVTNIRSNYNNEEKSSQTEFECHVGAIMAGVALKADFGKMEK
jgi:alpha-D-ribose 1-methylphosphonate 5-triphosphate synthase subunit PhnG